MGRFQEATVEFHGGSTSFITQFWVPDDRILAEAKRRLGPLAEEFSNFKVTIRRPLNRFEEFRAALSQGKDA